MTKFISTLFIQANFINEDNDFAKNKNTKNNSQVLMNQMPLGSSSNYICLNI